MESLSAGLRGLGSMVARAATAAGGGGDADGKFALGPAGMLAAEWTQDGLQLWILGADGTVEGSHCAAGVGVGDLATASSQGQGQQRFENVFEHQVRILEQQAGSSASHAGLRPALVCGAAGGRGGWCEVPCVGLPAGVKKLASAAVRVPTTSGRVVFMVPGCEIRAGSPTAKSPQSASDRARSATTKGCMDETAQHLDVLRGQETLVMGALITAVLHQRPGTVFRSERLFCVLVDGHLPSATSEPSAQQQIPPRPGQQSVWISTQDGAINWFRSYRTGMVCDALAPSAAYALT